MKRDSLKDIYKWRLHKPDILGGTHIRHVVYQLHWPVFLFLEELKISERQSRCVIGIHRKRKLDKGSLQLTFLKLILYQSEEK